MAKVPNIAVPFIGGLDTKTDEKMTPMGSLQLLENAVFTEHGNLKKRWGYNTFLPIDDSGASIEGARSLAAWGDTPVLITDTDIYAQSTVLGRWAGLGRFTAATVEEVHTPSVVGEQTSGDCISNGIITAQVWEDSRGGVRATVTDTVSGFVYAHDVVMDANGGQPRCSISGGAVLLIWLDTTNNEVHTQAISNGDPAGSIAGASTVIDNTLSAADAFDVVYDSYQNRALVCYTSSTANEGVKLRQLNQAGAVVASRDVVIDIYADYGAALAADTVNLAVCVRPTLVDDDVSAICVVGFKSDGTKGFYTLHESDLTFISGSVTVTSTTTAIHNFAISFTGTTGSVVQMALGENAGGSAWNDHVSFETVANTTCTLDQKLLHSRVETKAGTCAGKQWVVLSYVSPGLQHSHFLYDFSSREPVARIGYGNVTTVKVQDASSLWTIDDLTLHYCPAMRRRISTLGSAFETDGATHSTFENVENGHIQIHLSSAATVQSVQMGDTTYISSGMLLAFDGVRVEESAPMLFPEGITIADDTPGVYSDRLQAGSTYLYRVYYERLRTNGELTRSLALTFAHTVGLLNTNVELTLPTLSHTLADGAGDWRIAVYRSEADQTSLLFLCTSPDLTNTSGPNNYVANSITASTVTFLDDMADATLRTNDRDPQTDGVLPVVQPAGSKIIGEAADRVFLAGGEGRKAVVYPSLLHFPGEPVLFSDELQFPVEEEGGEITAMGAIDGILVVFKERRLYAVSGQGPDDTGRSGAFNVQRVTTDIGCSSPGSVVEYPDGLMFQSVKGIYAVDRSFNTEYIGWPVEIFNDQSIVSAEVIPDTNLVVFLTSSGNSVAYDYFYKKWTTFTGHAGLSAITVGGEYHYLRSDGEMYTRTESTYLDAGSWYPLRLRTAPIRLDSIQDYMQVHRVNIVGEYLSSHKLQMKVFNNRDIAPFETRVFKPDDVIDITLWGDADTDLWGDADTEFWGGLAGDSDYQFQHKFKRQKVQYLRLEFEDLQTSGASGQSYELSEMNFEIDLFDGNARIPAGRKL